MPGQNDDRISVADWKKELYEMCDLKIGMGQKIKKQGTMVSIADGNR